MMQTSDRPSRFAAMPGDIRIPSFYPTKPVGTLERWRVRLIVDGDAWRDHWEHEVVLHAFDSIDAVKRARDDFFAKWGIAAVERPGVPLRTLECLQVGT